jgi:hypothetical protein
MVTWALSLVAIIAMSADRTLLTSHDRCWIVGSLPYLLCAISQITAGVVANSAINSAPSTVA